MSALWNFCVARALETSGAFAWRLPPLMSTATFQSSMAVKQIGAVAIFSEHGALEAASSPQSSR